jgi:Papain fold toxin 1, glutamine deamidase
LLGYLGKAALEVSAALRGRMPKLMGSGPSGAAGAGFTASEKTLLSALDQLGDVNPGGLSRSASNCVACVRIGARVLAGGKAELAAKTGFVDQDVLESEFAAAFHPTPEYRTIQPLIDELKTAGNGAQSIFSFDQGANKVGHVINAVNINGEVFLFDFQSGMAYQTTGSDLVKSGFTGYSRYQALPVTPRKP